MFCSGLVPRSFQDTPYVSWISPNLHQGNHTEMLLRTIPVTMWKAALTLQNRVKTWAWLTGKLFTWIETEDNGLRANFAFFRWGVHCLFPLHFSLERFNFRSIFTLYLLLWVPISDMKIINKRTAIPLVLEFKAAWKKCQQMTPFH